MLKYVKLLIALLIVVSFWPTDEAQAQDLSCNRFLVNPNTGQLVVWPDSAIVQSRIGSIGDTVRVPVLMKVDTGVTFFSIYMDLDTTWLHPVVESYDAQDDLYYYEFEPTSLLDTSGVYIFLTSEPTYRDTVTNHLRLRWQAQLKDPFNPDLAISVQKGRGVIAYLKMVIGPNAQQLDQTTIDFYYANVLRTDTFPPVILGCQASQFADDQGNKIYYFTTVSGFVRMDSLASDPPIITSFTANPTNVTPGNASTLSWSVAGADSIFINTTKITNASQTSLQVFPSVTTVYTLYAWNSNPSPSTRSVTVTVGTITGNAPVVQSIVPSSYTITQGETVSFSVTATDADNDFMTLSAINMPQNATFGVGGSVTGTGTATGQFSFTPNTTQEGTFAVSFQAVDSKGATSQLVSVTITVEGIKFDILYSKSRVPGTPSGGVPGKASVLFPVDMVTAQTVYGIQFDMFYDYHWFTVDSIMTTPRTQDWVVYDNIGQQDGYLRILTFGMNNEELQTDTTNSTTILYIAMTIDSGAAWGTYPIYFDSGWESNNPDPQYPSLPLVTDSAAIQVDRFGDVNLDLRVDVADAVNIVATILGSVSLAERQADVADVISDNLVDVFDLVGVINMIYGVPVQPAPGTGGSGVLATVALDYNDMFSGSSDMLKVRSELPEDIAGVQIDLTYDPQTVVLGKPSPTAQSDGLTMTYKNDGMGHMKVLLHFTNPFNASQLIQSGAADLLDIPIVAAGDVEFGDETQLKLTEVKLSNAAARQVAVDGFGPGLPTSFTLYQNYPNPFNPTTTIDFALQGANQHVTLDIFNVLGQQVKNLVDRDMAAGQYSVEWDATNSGGSKVATGIYFYRLTASGQNQTKKMLLLK